MGTGPRRRLGGMTGLIFENPLLAGVAAIGFSVSFQTVAHLASEHGLPGLPVLYPLGIDVGILALIAESRHLLALKRSDVVPRAVAWALSAATVYANVHGSPPHDWVGRALHAVMPCLWIVFLELTRHRLVAAARADSIPFSRWVAAPLQTPPLWRRMRRDGVQSYALALALEDARLYARDLVRAAPRRERPAFTSLVRKRIRSGHLPDSVKRAAELSAATGRMGGYEDAVATFVASALALPEHVSAALANARQGASQSAPESGLRSDSPAPSGSASGAHSGSASGEAPRSASRRPRRINPVKASDEDLLTILLPLFDGGEEVNKYRIVKTIREKCGGRSVGDERAGRLLDLAEREYRAHRVVPIEGGRR